MRRTTVACMCCARSLVCATPVHDVSSGVPGRSPVADTNTASRFHRTLCLRHPLNGSTGQTQWTQARALFGGWKATKGTTEDAVPVAEAPHTTAATAAAPAQDASAAAKAEIKQLRQQVVDLKEALEASQETVKQLLVLTSGRSANTATPCSTPESPCGPCSGATVAAAKGARGACYVVRTSEELVDALRGRGSEHASRTILLDGKLFLLELHGTVEVDQARVSIVGNNATVIGHISVKGRGAVLAASDVFFLCPYGLDLRQRSSDDAGSAAGLSTAVKTTVNPTGKKPKENAAHLTPVISVTAGAGVHLDRCVLSNGRDGVYLGMGSHCTLNHVRVVNCIRGLYEGVGCRTSMIDECTFQANRYHVVLLGPNKAERANQLIHNASTATTTTAAHSGAFTATFSPDATAADVLAPGMTTASVIALQQTKAQVVLQHNPITDIYEDGWVDGKPVELAEADATAGLSDPLF